MVCNGLGRASVLILANKLLYDTSNGRRGALRVNRAAAEEGSFTGGQNQEWKEGSSMCGQSSRRERGSSTRGQNTSAGRGEIYSFLLYICLDKPEAEEEGLFFPWTEQYCGYRGYQHLRGPNSSKWRGALFCIPSVPG